ncbi:MAG: glycosyltransferase family 2 protein [Bacteroidia bacterium]
MKEPKVTVLMPVYNAEKYLREAIESILNQDFTDFEFIIINDGSVDSSGAIISSYSDPRIRTYDNGKNLGVIETLNKGLDLAKGEYVARMDCDDISAKNRLSVQVKYMDEHKEIGASGSFYYLLRKGKKALADFPEKDEEIRCFMIFNSPIAHPSAIVRTRFLKDHKLKYRTDFYCAEDYDFWSQISEFSQLSNIKEGLLTYRMHDSQITGNPRFSTHRNETVSALRTRHLKKMGVVPDVNEIILHNMISDGLKANNIEEINAAEVWLKKLIDQNAINKKLDKNYFEKIVLERWLRVCFNYLGAAKGLKHCYNSSLYSSIRLPLRSKLELINTLYNSWKRLKIK